MMGTIEPTVENLRRYATEPLMRWLIEATQHRSPVTYAEAKNRLEQEIGFKTIFSTMMGKPAGAMMEDIQVVEPSAPLLNVLLVRQSDRLPGDGAGSFMAKRFHMPELANENIRKDKPELWEKYFHMAAHEVYAYENWAALYERVYGTPYQPSTGPLAPYSLDAGTEVDGSKYGGPEGENHRNLRLWAKGNPYILFPNLKSVRAETEQILKSADRVDVVYYAPDITIAIEVKSRDSNTLDIERGIYQCIKYRAVMQAMDPRRNTDVRSVLLTEEPLPGYLKALADTHAIQHIEYRLNKDT